MYDHLRPSYEEIHNACVDLVRAIEREMIPFKYVAGIARGGLLPAVVMSHIMNLPLLLVDYSSKEGNGDDKDHGNNLPVVTPADGPVLIVDDICDSGKTLKEIIEHFTSNNVIVYTAVLYFKTLERQLTVPDFVWRTIPHDAGWVIFPYERNELLTPDVNAPTRYLQSLVRA